MKLELSKIKDAQPQREHGNITDLKESIKKLGLLQPLVVTPEYSLVAGRRRYQALTELGISEVSVNIVNPKDDYIKFLMALDENLKRKEMSWQEIAFCEKEEKRIYEEVYGDTEENRIAKVKRNLPNVDKPDSGLSEIPPSYVEAKSQVTGQSKSLIKENIQLAKAIEENPELKKVKTKEGALKIIRNKNFPEVELPKGKYQVIYADPPWQYNDSGLDDYGHAERHYKTMSINELCNLDVCSLAHNDAVLFLWATSPLLEDAFKVINAWGFKYKTSFIWDKIKHNYGHYNSVRHEFLLVCTKGSCTPDSKKLYDSVFSIERAKHSEKPSEFRQMIEELYRRSKIELFARQKREGWESWGNEL